MGYCPRCGTKVPDGNSFCIECGYNVGGNASVSPQTIIDEISKSLNYHGLVDDEYDFGTTIRYHSNVYINGSTIDIYVGGFVQYSVFAVKKAMAKKKLNDFVDSKIQFYRSQVSRILSSLGVGGNYEVVFHKDSFN